MPFHLYSVNGNRLECSHVHLHITSCNKHQASTSTLFKLYSWENATASASWQTGQCCAWRHVNIGFTLSEGFRSNVYWWCYLLFYFGFRLCFTFCGLSQNKRDAPPVFSVVYNVLMSALSVFEWDKDTNKIKNMKKVTVLHAHKRLLKNPVLTSTGAQTGGHFSPATVAIVHCSAGSYRCPLPAPISFHMCLDWGEKWGNVWRFLPLMYFLSVSFTNTHISTKSLIWHFPSTGCFLWKVGWGQAHTAATNSSRR